MFNAFLWALWTTESKSGRGLEGYCTLPAHAGLARISMGHEFRQVLECGSPLPLWIMPRQVLQPLRYQVNHLRE